jgi:uncharacterized protein YjbI with pentapeptide repeats
VSGAPFAEPTAPRLPEPGELPEAELPFEPAPLGVEVQRCTIRGGSLANADLARSSWRAVQLTRVRMTGVRLSEARMTDVLLEECLVDLAALAGARLERVALVGCRLAGSDLQGLQARDLRLEGCDLSDTDLSDASFSRTIALGCSFDGARGLDRLRGVGMRAGDVVAAAGAFADALGIRLLN